MAEETKTKTTKATEKPVSAEVLALQKEKEELLKKLELSTQHISKIDPEVQVRYKGIRENFVFRKHDFSKGICVMLKSQAKELIDFDPRCFELV